jgi:D-alanyl-D-alanine carboxypeptidase/D-alanyl-D-alanine-endopeptidase (penicillin-binding protein 4)
MPYRLRLFVALALLSLSATLAAPPAQARTIAPADATASRLAAQVREALRGSSAKHIDYSIHVAGVGTIAHDANRASAPASNQKLFTTITLLQMLGPEFRYTTTISGTSKIDRGVLPGDLVLRASGDPTLTRSDLQAFAKRLHEKGLRHVTGRLIVDDTRYSHVTRVPGWKHKFVPVETGTVDAFTIDDNEWRGGRAFEANPTPDNAALWRKALKKSHITVKGRTRIAHAPPILHRLVTHHSLDLAAITDDTLTNSINFNAEMMLREAGAQHSGHGSPATGVAAERAVARNLHLPLGTVHDGSGLSYSDRETPATIRRWLARLTTLPIYRTVYFALPLSCDTGTLEGRLCGPNVRGRIRAKTGSLDHNSALSGYFETKSQHFVTFSILASGFKDKNFSKVVDHVSSAVAIVLRNG